MKLSDVHKTAEEIKQLTEKYMIETYERFDFVAQSAKGMYLYDEKGEGFLDFYGGIAVNSAGNCNDAVVAAVRDQVGDIMHTFNYPYTIPQALLAELICTTLGMDKIFFQSTGTEANEAMIKMARKYGVEHYGPTKYHILSAKGSFHGRTYGALSATGQPDNACQIGFKPMLPGFSYAEFNNLDDFRSKVTDDTIAIMLEPIQGEGGVNPATPEFMKGIAALCKEKGLLLILDEVQSGWCRSGKVMAYMHYGIKPDIVSMAKAMGGGMPISAICATNEAATAFSSGSHGTTFGGNPVCCAAAYAEIHELLDRKLAEHAQSVGEYFVSILSELPHVKEVRGKGLMIGVELTEPIGLEVKHGCLDRHLLVTLIGDRVIRLIPPLIATQEDCEKACSILEQAINAAVEPITQ
ncbi:MAG: acetylornithine/succinylornithine family transaminase [Sporolactobacillus sp.]